MRTFLILIVLVTAAKCEPRHRPPTPPQMIDMDEVAQSLIDYAMWREEHSRTTFPIDMPKVGEPYDPATGNAVRIKQLRG